MMASGKRITVKFLVMKEKRRVVLADADKDFVDILFSFLTLPMGTIIRLLGADSSIGSMANLYRSIENLDNQYLQTEACKDMLLRPISAARRQCENLTVNIDDTEPRKFYTCQESDCSAKATCFYSSVPNALCCCGKQLYYVGTWKKMDVDAAGGTRRDGVFVKGGLRFTISDDLRITLASTAVLLSLFEKLGIEDRSVLEERIVDLGPEEISNLLKRTLISRTPLTDLCFSSSATNDAPNESEVNVNIEPVPKAESEGDSERKEIKVKLLLSKNSNKVLHMEGGEDMVDLMLSFLTFPLGFVIRLNKKSSMGCVDNLCRSVEGLSSEENDYIKSEECKMMLLSPELPPFFSCKNQLLKIIELESKGGSYDGCYTCFRKAGTACKSAKCSHGVENANFKELNPKSPNGGTEPGEAYANGPGNFMVTDDLRVAPLSPISAVQIINELEVPISSLVEEEASVGETQALNLLKAALVSKTTLSDVFSPYRRRRRALSLV